MEIDGHAVDLPEGVFLPFYGVDGNCFKLGDKAYEVVEDPDDGYRSSMGAFERARGGLIFFPNPVAEVAARKATLNRKSNDEICELVDRDGHIWLEFGTANANDYYPYFVFDYSPKGT